MRAVRLTRPRSSPAHLVVLTSAEPETMAVAHLDGLVVLADALGNTRTVTIDDDVIDVDVDVHTCGSTIAVALPGAVRILSPGRGTALLELAGHEGRVGALTMAGCPRRGRVLSTDERGNVHRWCLREGRPSVTVRRAHRKMAHTAFHTRLAPARPVFVTASDDREVLVHDAGTDEIVRRLGPHAGWIGQASGVEEGGVLTAVATTDRVGVTIWDVPRGVAVARIPVGGASDPVVVADRGIHVAARSADSEVVMSSAHGTRHVGPPSEEPVVGVVLTSYGSGRPVLRVATGRRILRLGPGERWTPCGAAFPAPILHLRSWRLHPGAVVALEDGSVWLARW